MLTAQQNVQKQSVGQYKVQDKRDPPVMDLSEFLSEKGSIPQAGKDENSKCTNLDAPNVRNTHVIGIADIEEEIDPGPSQAIVEPKTLLAHIEVEATNFA